ncbi:alanine--tRNA ligase-like [Setaria italica]|uniref:alanine--tRNA ligase-like n=1 Tax=Setaria italica TaxID=4555 RepID=UPI000BE4BA9D|nr:alanine--tRNA ligase-like [Setaria italica]
MNITDDKFVEICRLVFVEFDRQADDVLGLLQAKHVLTGINLECLAVIFQNKESHYDLDVYADVLSNIYYCAGPGIEDYSNKIGAADTDGVDMAYRLLADHIRMIAVTNAPGSQLGNVLLLGEKITLNLDIKKVLEGHLIYLVQSYLLYGNTQM